MRKKLSITLFLILFLSLIIVPVGAKQNDNFVAGENVKLKQGIGATTFAAGNTIDAATEIDGAFFVAGNALSLSSSQDILFAGGNTINLDGVITKDAFLAGSNINIKTSTIRDLYAAAQIIKIDSEIDRNAYLGGDTVIINSRISGDVEVSADNIKLGEQAEILGKLHYPENANLEMADGAQVAKKTTYKVDTSENDKSFASVLMDQFKAFLSMLLIGVILMALNKKAFDRIEKIKKDVSVFAKTVGVGFLVLIAVPVGAIILLCTVIGIPLSIISLMLYGIMIYLSMIPTAYYIGNVCLKDKIKNKYYIFTISLLVLYIIRMIPVIGGLVTFIALCFGLGVYAGLIKSSTSSKTK